MAQGGKDTADTQALLEKDDAASSTPPSDGKSTKEISMVARVSAALFYALASIMIMLINKQVLTGFKFPSFQVC